MISAWISIGSVSWGCRKYQLHLCRRVNPHSPNKCPQYDIKQSDGEAQVMLELQGMWSTSSLPLLPGPLWPQSCCTWLSPIYGLNRIFWHLNWVQTNDWCLIGFLVMHYNTWNHLTVCKRMSLISFKCYRQNVFTSHIYLIYKEDLALNNLQWLICYQTKHNCLLFNHLTSNTWNHWTVCKQMNCGSF